MSNIKEDGTLADFYQNFIAISRYARWDENEGRREVFSETVDRLVTFFEEDLTERVGYDVSKKVLKEVREAVLAQDVMPSMRALMTAGPALKRNHIAAYNPVSGDTPVLTKEYGMVNIESIAGQDVTVLNKDGRWAEAKINHHGQQELRLVELKRTGSSVTISVKATPDHRWYKTDGEVVSTADLQPGDLIPSAKAPRPATDNIDYELGLLHGLIYGDGTTTYSQERVSGYHIRLCGTSRQLAGLFAEHGKICYPPSANGDPVVQMYGAFAKTHGLKDLPSEDESLEYILGFIRGWLAADGSVAKEREATLCLNEDNIEWFKRNSPRVGILYNGTQELNPVTNFGDRKKRAFSIRLDRNSLVEEDFIIPEKRERFAKSRDYDYRVVSVSNLELVDDVYCASVPDTNTFVLSHGIVTGNCSFVPVDTLRAFDETLLVLMQGTGLGFSVEAANVNKLPEVAESFHKSDTIIKVGDSKEGWAKAYKELIAMVWSGNIPEWDMSAVRPAGARLKTFGGRASGPEPLEQLFKHTISVVKGAAGRKLKPIEAHSIMCKIAEVVVVGGVRRSALISLSDLDDYEMARAKSGAWWETKGHFGLANNSAVYKVKPSVEHFMDEWKSLIESKSGERGIFNLYAAQLLTERFGRRDASQIAGTNPCSEINLRNNEFCNLTEVIVKPGDSLDDLKKKVELATILGTWQSTLTDIKYLRKVWKNNIEEERLLGVSLTGQFGHKVLNGSEGMEKLAEWLEALRDHAIEVNKKEAAKIGIPQSAAITCVKPSGCRPGEAITVTDSGIFTLDELLAEHPVDSEWSSVASELKATNGDAITKTYRNGVAEVAKITLGNNFELESTYNHQWYVSKYHNGHKYLDFEPQWVKTEDLVPGHIIETAIGVYNNTDEAEMTNEFVAKTNSNQDIVVPEKMSPELAWLLGYLWGDGCMTLPDKKGRLRFIDEHKYNLERVQEVLKNLFNKDSRIVKASGQRNAWVIEVASTKIVGFFIENGIWKYGENGLADIPMIVRKSSRDSILAFIAGLIDSDGGVYKKESAKAAMISTSDGSFAKHVQNVAASCGIIFGRSHNTGGSNLQESRSMWLMTVANATEIDAMNDLAKHSNKAQRLLTDLEWTCKSKPKTIFGKVRSVEYSREVETFDIEVADSHWYHAGVFKSHNTVSQLCGVSSGMHPWHSQYYIRTVRGDNKDPLTQFMKDQGIPNEPDVMNPNNTTVFSFPVAAPEGAVTREDITAIDHLELWLAYQRHWCEHKPSVTVSVKDDEWLDVGAWVYRHFDEVSGVSFLPHTDHTYQQAPYQEITESEYNEFLKKMPADIDWTDMEFYEQEDTTTGSQELACVAGACDVADLTGVEDESINTGTASIPELLTQPAVMAQ